MGMFLWFAAAALVVALCIAVIVVFLRPSAHRRMLPDGVPSLVRVTLAVAVLWAGIALVGAIVTTITTLVQTAVPITVPTQTYWPTLPDGAFVEGTTATREGGGFVSADVVVNGLSFGARICWAIGQALWWILPGAIASMVALACFQLIRGRAFAPVLAQASMVIAVIVSAGGVAAQVLSDIAGSMASAELLSYSGGGYEEVAGVEDVLAAWWPQEAFVVNFPFWPIAAGLAFAALAAVLRRGAHLQRETEGLV
ncbi:MULTISPECIES: hypothetical protein [unclassified Microbacterium]|uniref:hypothetical protein n=1 Tax=unclassified Microbacterium TaxID=2609290 RepID=UPI002CCE8793|nr:hypothetical protein [Microbacterium sp.]HWK78841.1 hypothetical protein [Microbacterium sp.]